MRINWWDASKMIIIPPSSKLLWHEAFQPLVPMLSADIYEYQKEKKPMPPSELKFPCETAAGDGLVINTNHSYGCLTFKINNPSETYVKLGKKAVRELARQLNNWADKCEFTPPLKNYAAICQGNYIIGTGYTPEGFKREYESWLRGKSDVEIYELKPEDKIREYK